MKIIHIVESMHSAGGGLPAAVKALMRLQRELGYEVSCCATAEPAQPDAADGAPGPARDALIGAISAGGYDFVHFHGVWNTAFVRLCLACRQSATNYMVTTHGQLLSTILASDGPAKRIKKLLYRFVVGNWLLRGATKVHVSSENELAEFRRHAWLRDKTFYIPHILDLCFLKADDVSHESSPGNRDILFVGRLDPRKGILKLVEGFAGAGLPAPWGLRIVGPRGSDSFMQELEDTIAALGLAGRVTVEQPIYGDARQELYRHCYLFCLPSYSEAPGLVNVEAALLGRPVLTTPYTGLFAIAQNGGMLCEPTAEDIQKALLAALAWTKDEYAARSVTIQKWARSEYALEQISPQWRAFYSA